MNNDKSIESLIDELIEASFDEGCDEVMGQSEGRSNSSKLRNEILERFNDSN